MFSLSITLMLLLISLFVVRKVSSDGKVSLRFVTYVNPGGKGSNGHCCDGRWGFCHGSCDHMFEICVDKFYGDNDINHCAIGKRASDRISEQNTNRFGNKIANLPNPIVLPFTDWEVSGVKIKVIIRDYDKSNSHDLVETLRKRINISPARNENEAGALTSIISSRTTLTVELKAFCDDNWYGRACMTYCVPTDDVSGHYDCNELTGEKTCLSGWTGGNCETEIRYCESNPCQQESSCENVLNGYICHCQLGYSGQHCDVDIDECLSSPCLSGTCLDLVGKFQCECVEGYEGQHCDVDIDECLSSPCLSGTCIDLVGKFQCECVEGYEGVRCGHNIDECRSSPCNHGACIDLVNNYKCICDQHYEGPICADEIDYCKFQTCENNGTCVPLLGGFNCTCSQHYTGELCNSTIDYCDSHPCSNRSTCTNNYETEQGYICLVEETTESPVFTTTDRLNITINCSTEHNPCDNNATCLTKNGSDDICLCTKGFTGQLCEYSHGYQNCSFNPCQNNGSCVDKKEEFTCQCLPEYIGHLCEHFIPTNNETFKKNATSCGITCMNNGTCIILNSNMSDIYCNCTEGWEGIFCEKESESKNVTKNHNIDDSCSNVTCQNNGTCKILYSENVNKSDGGLPEKNHEDIDEYRNATKDFTSKNESKYSQNVHSNYTGHNESETNYQIWSNSSKEVDVKSSQTNFVCECIEGFAGEFCEIQVNDHDTEEKDKGDKNESGSKEGFEAYPSALLFEGKLTKAHVEDVVEQLKQIIMLYTETKTQDIQVDFEIRTCLSDSKEHVDILVFNIKVHDKTLPWDTVDQAFSNHTFNSLNEIMPLNLYQGKQCTPVKKTDANINYQKVVTKGWIDRYWYIIIVAAILVVIILTGIALMIYRKKRRTEKVEIKEYPCLVTTPNGTGSNQNVPVSCQSYSQRNSSAVNPHCFENQMYEYDEIPANTG